MTRYPETPNVSNVFYDLRGNRASLRRKKKTARSAKSFGLKENYTEPNRTLGGYHWWKR